MRQINVFTGYLYSVRDLRLDLYQTPFAARSDVDAVRLLMQISERSDSVVFAFPRDYVLYCVGEFDYDKAVVRPYDSVEQVCDMSYILRQVQAERELNSQESFLDKDYPEKLDKDYPEKLDKDYPEKLDKDYPEELDKDYPEEFDGKDC